MYKFRTAPYDHQKEVFYQTRDLEGHGVFWEMGTGKTKLIVDITAYAFQEGRINSLLVLAPKGVHEIWQEEFSIHCPQDVLDRARFFTYHSDKAATKYHRQDMGHIMSCDDNTLSVICMAYDGVKTPTGWALFKEFLRRRRCLEVLDESIRIKTPNTRLSKRVHLYRDKAVMRRVLDGTPISNSPFDIYSPARFVDPSFWRSRGLNDFTEFKDYFGEYGTGYVRARGKLRKFPKFEGYKRMPLLQKWIEEIGSRVVKDDVLDLPPKVFRTPYRYDLTKEQRRVYDEMDQEFETTLASGVELEEELVITKLIRLQQIMCGFVGDGYGNLHRIAGKNPRLELLKGILGDKSVAGTQMIIWAHMVPCLDDITGFLGKRCVRYTDKKSVEPWVRGDVQYLVANQMAAARGHTWTHCHSALYYSNPPGRNDLRLQSEDRNHRSGQTESVDYGDIVSRNTKEQGIIDALRKQIKISAYLMGDREPQKRW